MAIIVNGTELDTVMLNGTALDEVYCNNVLVYVSTIYVARPSLSGSFTFDNTEKTITVNGFDSAAMTQTGTVKATAAGTYTVTWTLKDGYAWADTETTEDYSLTWSIAKRSITIPTMTNKSYTWALDTTFAPTITGVASSYVTQTGTTSSTKAGSWTVTWALKYPASTKWSDNTTANKTDTWAVAKKKLTIPTMTNKSYTWAVNTTFKPTISGVTANYVTQTGTVSSTSAGSWTITWKLVDTTNTTWTDGTTANKTDTWAVAKRKLTIPSLSGTTSFAFVEDTTRSVTVSNFNSTYETQSGTTSTDAQGSYTITWTLRYSANTTWSDGTTANKTATWSISWVNGTSHYSNDLYNKGWKVSDLTWYNNSNNWVASWGTASINYTQCSGSNIWGAVTCSTATTRKLNGKTIHITFTNNDTRSYSCRIGYRAFTSGLNIGTAVTTSPTTIPGSSTKEITGTLPTTATDYTFTFDFGNGYKQTCNCSISRIWYT